MQIESKIHVSLKWDGHALLGVHLAPRRLLDISRLVRGKSAAEAARTIPLLFGLCGKAQGVAAALALAAAQGRSDISPEHERQVVGEAFQEMAWRFLIDLPQCFGMAPDPQALALLRKHCAAPSDDLEAFISAHFLGISCRDWREFTTAAQLENWLAQALTPLASILRRLWDDEGNWGNSAVALLPDFSAQQMVEEMLPALLDDPGFAARPHWRGQAAETGAVARLAGHPLLPRQDTTIAARLLARLLELAQLAGVLRGDTLSHLGWVHCAQVQENTGLAWLQTSRGLLLHYAQVENGQVADYRIIAPTEWNFHPDGAFTCGLTGKTARSEKEARHHAELLLLALDPCVGYEISVVAPAS